MTGMRLPGVVAAVALLGAPATARAADCVTPAGAKVVESRSEAVVTVETHSDGRDFLDGGTTLRIWRGCARSTGQQIELERIASSWGWFGSASSFALAGTYAAYEVTVGDKYQHETRLTVADLADGSRRDVEYLGGVGGTGILITGHAVNRLGDVAWIRTGYSGDRRWVWRLYLDRGEGPVEHARSRRPLRGLRLGTLRLQWRERGKLRTRRIDD